LSPVTVKKPVMGKLVSSVCGDRKSVLIPAVQW